MQKRALAQIRRRFPKSGFAVQITLIRYREKLYSPDQVTEVSHGYYPNFALTFEEAEAKFAAVQKEIAGRCIVWTPALPIKRTVTAKKK